MIASHNLIKTKILLKNIVHNLNALRNKKTSSRFFLLRDGMGAPSHP